MRRFILYAHAQVKFGCARAGRYWMRMRRSISDALVQVHFTCACAARLQMRLGKSIWAEPAQDNLTPPSQENLTTTAQDIFTSPGKDFVTRTVAVVFVPKLRRLLYSLLQGVFRRSCVLAFWTMRLAETGSKCNGRTFYFIRSWIKVPTIIHAVRKRLDTFGFSSA